MSAPTRYPNGVTNAAKNGPLSQYGLPDPSTWHTFFDDFDDYDAAQWVITTVEAGAGSASEGIQNEDGGVLRLLNDDADNDSDFLQWSGVTTTATRETFLFETGKKLAFKARFKVSDATQSDFIMGLQLSDTTPLNVNDGVFFQKDDGDTNLDIHVEKDNTQTSGIAIHTVVDDTYLEAAFFYNGADTVEAFINDAKVATLEVTNLPDDEELTISFGIQNGEAAATSMSIDYIFVAKER